MRALKGGAPPARQQGLLGVFGRELRERQRLLDEDDGAVRVARKGTVAMKRCVCSRAWPRPMQASRA